MNTDGNLYLIEQELEEQERYEASQSMQYVLFTLR